MAYRRIVTEEFFLLVFQSVKELDLPLTIEGRLLCKAGYGLVEAR
jgi:hypothetical protein